MTQPHRPVPQKPSFPRLEEEVLGRWREHDVFHESVRRREGAPDWVFYEGPPTANGRPGSHHVLSRVFKDLYPRYRTMRGYRVERKGGWDCHGLPVEIEVEKQLGIASKDEIEGYGIAEFNARCRESVFEFLEDWNRLTERIGFWIDLDDAYRTLDRDYIESVAVDPELTYVRARSDGSVLVVAEALVERVLGDGAEVLDRFPGRALVGNSYEPPFPFIPADAYGERGHSVVPGDFVTAEEGTGLVHTAVAFGEDDFRLGEQQGLAVVNPVTPGGTYDERVGPFAGRSVKDADPDLVADLEARGRVLRSESYAHAYPHCWRCGTPLLYYAKPSWYIRTQEARDELLAANETVNWHPEHIKHGRFGKWLENNVDWALSRERYWGTPLPVWRCDAGHVHCIGSYAELRERSGRVLEDPHRPYVDDVVFPCPKCGEEMRRVPEVIDVWFDSGSMPFAQYHAPFENEEHFEARFPADFICEALDQTRGWFYSLLAISTMLFGSSSYRTVLCLGLILDPEGKKMSKSLGNIVDPWEVIDRFGADAFRWYFFTAKQPWDGYRFSAETIGEGVRQFLLQLWNTYAFYILYANVNDMAPAAAPPGDELDRWALSRLAATTERVRERLDAYDATFAGRAIAEFVDDLSNWYVRRSRRRFWDGDPAAFATLRP